MSWELGDSFVPVYLSLKESSQSIRLIMLKILTY